MPKTWMEARLDKEKEKDVPTPPCWCGDVCKVKVSTDRKKSWTEGRRFFVCPNYVRRTYKKCKYVCHFISNTNMIYM